MRTPGPLYVEEASRGQEILRGYPGVNVQTEAENSEGELLGDEPNGALAVAHCFGPDADDNAAFIVKACNSHDKLVVLLQEVEKTFSGLLGGQRIRANRIPIILKIRDALEEVKNA